MKIDPDYVRGLLLAFEDAPGPTTDIRFLESKGYSYETDEFAFHMEILSDRALIEMANGDRGVGLSRGLDGHNMWSVVSLRMTSRGHETLASMRDPEAWNRTKKNLSKVGNFGLDIMVSAAKAYTKQILQEKLGISLG